MMPMQPDKPAPRSDDLEKLRRELLRRIVQRETQRQDTRRNPLNYREPHPE
jgi:hypothetical protein